MKKLSLSKTLLLTLCALASSPAMADDPIPPTYDCTGPFINVINNASVVILKCTNKHLDISNATMTMTASGESEVTNTPITVSDAGRQFTIYTKQSLTLNNSAMTVDGAIFEVGVQSTLTLNSNSNITVNDGGTLRLKGNSTVINNDPNNIITLNKGAQLIFWTPKLIQNVKWNIPDEWTLEYRGGKLPDELDHFVSKKTTLQVQQVTVPPDLATRSKEMIVVGHDTYVSTLGDKTSMIGKSSMIYSGTQTDKAEKIILNDKGGAVLELTGNLGDFDASFPGTWSKNYILPSNNDTHYTAFSENNFTVIQARKNPNPNIHYYGTTTPNWANLFLVGKDPNNPAILTLEKTLPPLDLSGFRAPTSSNFDVYRYGFVQHNANGIIELNADQTITKFSTLYGVKVLAGKTLTYAQTDITPFYTDTDDQTPIGTDEPIPQRMMLSGDGMLRLTAPNPTWIAIAFNHISDKTGLTVVFANADPSGNTINTHKVWALPTRFEVATNTIVDTDSGASSDSIINVDGLEGSIELSDDLDFSQANPFPQTWHIKKGNGSLVLKTSHFTHPADLVGKDIPIATGAYTFSVVLQGDDTVKDGFTAYTYQLKTKPGFGGTQEWMLTVVAKDITPIASASTLLSMAQPGIEAQIRMDTLRLNHEVWHTERNSHEGLYTWIRAVGTYQKSSALQDPLIEARYGHEAYAAGVNLGGEYQWSLGAQGQAVALSLATEYLSGARTVGDVRFKETRFNTALGLRLQGEQAYSALSVQWMNVGHKVMDTDQDFGHQHALEVSGEVGLNLHVTPSAGLTPFVQYNWTRFDEEYASYHLPNQHHLQLGAYLTMPWVSDDGITVRNQLGLSTVLSVMNNDMPSLQAFWGLHLDGQHFGVQLETSTEYAPGDQRRTVEVTLGTHYAF